MPGLILVDGGKTQLTAALEALDEAGVAGVPVISLAKREEILYTPESRKGIRLDRTSPALKLVEHVRDEAHRFAVAFHRGRRAKKSFASALDGIPGLGPKRKAALLARYKGVDGIRNASLEDLAALVGRAPAAALKLRFGL
jgi:excinuclease ABC subunit C